MGNPGLAEYYKTNSPNIFQTKGDYVEKFCVLFYKQANPDRMEFF